MMGGARSIRKRVGEALKTLNHLTGTSEKAERRITVDQAGRRSMSAEEGEGEKEDHGTIITKEKRTQKPSGCSPAEKETHNRVGCGQMNCSGKRGSKRR